MKNKLNNVKHLIIRWRLDFYLMLHQVESSERRLAILYTRTHTHIDSFCLFLYFYSKSMYYSILFSIVSSTWYVDFSWVSTWFHAQNSEQPYSCRFLDNDFCWPCEALYWSIAEIRSSFMVSITSPSSYKCIIKTFLEEKRNGIPLWLKKNESKARTCQAPQKWLFN